MTNEDVIREAVWAGVNEMVAVSSRLLPFGPQRAPAHNVTKTEKRRAE
jgi:hypothetical protein